MCVKHTGGGRSGRTCRILNVPSPTLKAFGSLHKTTRPPKVAGPGCVVWAPPWTPQRHEVSLDATRSAFVRWCFVGQTEGIIMMTERFEIDSHIGPINTYNITLPLKNISFESSADRLRDEINFPANSTAFVSPAQNEGWGVGVQALNRRTGENLNF